VGIVSFLCHHLSDINTQSLTLGPVTLFTVKEGDRAVATLVARVRSVIPHCTRDNREYRALYIDMPNLWHKAFDTAKPGNASGGCIEPATKSRHLSRLARVGRLKRYRV
jgi:hypothetical protein